MGLLESIEAPEDVKKLKESELRVLANEIRKKILETVATNGGHLASNLGVVELTIALHKVFDSPRDAIVWDVGHQSYAHKLITGRFREFDKIRKKDGLSGFPKRSESVHDIFDTGHSSTSLSSALGLLESRNRQGRGGRVVAVIGDGALTAGMAFEALVNVSQLELPLIVILNDNKMSISRNVGALSRYLSRLTATEHYQHFRRSVDSAVVSIPRVGRGLLELIVRGKRAVKAIFFKENLFADLGFEYVGPIDGHNIPVLLSVLAQVKRLQRPVVIHVVTKKGNGFFKAEEDPEAFHGVAPSCPDLPVHARPSYTEVFGRLMVDLALENRELVAITAAMSKGTGLEKLAKLQPSRVYDVGIAEQHAVTFAAGLATGGLLPVVAVYSTFMQRAVDQVLHDVALPNHHVVFALDRSGAVGEDGETHQGFFDIALFKSLPNSTILAPSCAAEMASFLRFAINWKGPVFLRFPKARVECDEPACDSPLLPGRGVFLRKREKATVLVCALGALAHAAARATDRLDEQGVPVDLYSLRFASPLDEQEIAAICTRYKAVAVVEEGIKAGGVGESIASIFARKAVRAKISILGFGPRLPAQASREELLADAGLDEEGLSTTFGIIAAEAAAERMDEAHSIIAG